ncbi:arabinose efflux permease family protein [Sanguibacter keddieii DSM 10542]|uniref:Arabinose efflux permease family protein n=1 Tax=Sanguibacter keddieii (strain ATCC 51767 / DSM 10542 / NCFB 3025 / ST-74) TaxID=446469 RepID=D1BHN4_SANKS|nr:MFS transporter [Sanguibacter keddieii]ACZ21954.1 arabinose efflux permease family protein [Sanguibacter keddieii DSM 10542]
MSPSTTVSTTPPATRLPIAALSVFALLGFVLISTETMPAGILPQIAGGMDTSVGLAGQLVSAYALGTVLITIPAITLTRSRRRKPLFLAGTVLFVVANTITAISSDIALSLVSRFIAGGLSGMLWGMFAGYAVRITPPSLTGRALSIVATGAPVGIAFGTPLGTWLGTTFDWRWSFGGLTIITLAVLALAALLLPDAPGQGAMGRLPLTRVLKIPGVAAILMVIFAWMLGNSTTYTYITPYLEAARSGVSIELLLVVFGIASIGGIAMTATFIDKAPRALVVLSLIAFASGGLILCVGHRWPVAIYAGAVLWGMGFGGASPQMQRPLTAVSGENADVANSFLPVAFNLAIFGAGVLGALLLTNADGLILPLTMTASGVAALIVVVAFRSSIYPARRR